jgi:hypothetical protein
MSDKAISNFLQACSGQRSVKGNFVNLSVSVLYQHMMEDAGTGLILRCNISLSVTI